jgi:large subunit ribosomal protein L7/L12
MAKLKKEDVLDYLETASMLEVSELITDIEEKFGVSAAAPVAVAAAPAAGGDGGAAEAKSEFDIELTGVGEKKINVIKIIREITALGLKESKDLADGAPSVIKEAVAADEANEMKTKLEEAGATVTLK